MLTVFAITGSIAAIVLGILAYRRHGFPFALSVVLLITIMGCAGTYFIKQIAYIPPAGPKPAGGCGTIERLWTEQSGGGGSLLVQDPIKTNYFMAVRFQSGEGKTLSVDRDDFGTRKAGDLVTVEWSKTEIGNMAGGDGEVWLYTLKNGCPKP